MPALEPTRPTGWVRAAGWCYLAAAALNVIVGATTLAAVPATLRELNRTGHATPTGPVILAIVVVTVATLAFSVLLTVLVRRLWRGGQWARPALMTVSLLALAGIPVAGTLALAVVLVLIAAAIVITRAPVTAWLRTQRGLAAV